MFDFQKLDVYQKAKSFNLEIRKLLSEKIFEMATKDQLRSDKFIH
jgi:hypothetical protein